MPSKSADKKRCGWVSDDPLYQEYHDREWGVPLHDDRRLFEMIILEGAQAGLSWITVLKKRENYRLAFSQFDAQKIARYDGRKKRTLMNNAGIIRNRLKIDATIGNARSFLKIVEEHGSFSDYLWDFVDGRPIVNRWRKLSDIPVSTARSDALSKALKSRGFKFVGTTICYSFMQAVGMVNDHVTSCFRYAEVAKSPKSREKSH
jgi:DNA-3-methyladenine glycosylase I